MCFLRAIPLSCQSDLLDMVIGRLRDKASIVRKYAIQLLKSLLIHNPFHYRVRALTSEINFSLETITLNLH